MTTGGSLGGLQAKVRPDLAEAPGLRASASGLPQTLPIPLPIQERLPIGSMITPDPPWSCEPWDPRHENAYCVLPVMAPSEHRREPSAQVGQFGVVVKLCQDGRRATGVPKCRVNHAGA